MTAKVTQGLVSTPEPEVWFLLILGLICLITAKILPDFMRYNDIVKYNGRKEKTDGQHS